MCLIGIRWQPEEHTLQIAANRDEFHARPAMAAQWWDDDPSILGGRDLEAGGTWLAVNRAGWMAAVTNVRKPGSAGPAARSRGALPVTFLRRRQTAEQFAKGLDGAGYGPFNLLLFDRDSLWWTSNQDTAPQVLDGGIFGLSNAALDTDWPKVAALKDAMATSSEPDLLFEALAHRTLPTGKLPDTGVGEALERLLAPPFIVSERYGTRCSTVLTIAASTVTFQERQFDAEGNEQKRGQTTFSLE